jgi:methylphosphotriester-DNA--protein-cysteine methyltransferase
MNIKEDKLNLSFEEKYAVMGTKDTAYEGLFITAVTSL